MNIYSPFRFKVLLSAGFLLKFYLRGTSMSFQSMANYISTDPMFRSLLIGPWPKKRVVNWVQTLSGIESSRKKFFYVQLQVQELTKIILARVKIEDLNIRIFDKFLLNIEPSYICCHLNKQINKKPPIRFSRAWSLQKSCHLIGRLHENSWY